MEADEEVGLVRYSYQRRMSDEFEKDRRALQPLNFSHIGTKSHHFLEI